MKLKISFKSEFKEHNKAHSFETNIPLKVNEIFVWIFLASTKNGAKKLLC